MSLKSNIRSIPLLGNVDLTNFEADVHDYEGFRKDNSFFLNKRKVNWWKREDANGEIGSLRSVINGDYFDLYKNSSKIGQIKRDYYKLENVSATAWEEEETNKIYNVYNKALIVLPNQKTKAINEVFVDDCIVNGAYWQCFIDFETTEAWILKNAIQQQYFRLSDINDFQSVLNDADLSKFSFSFLVPETDTVIVIAGYGETEPRLKFLANTGYIFFGAPSDGKIKYESTAPSWPPAFPNFVGSEHFYIKDANTYGSDSLYYNNAQGPGGDPIYGDVDYRRYSLFPFGKNTVIVFETATYKNPHSQYISHDTYLTVFLFTNSAYTKVYSYASKENTQTIAKMEYTFSQSFTNVQTVHYNYNNDNAVYIFDNNNLAYSKQISYSKTFQIPFNYSVKYGSWAINFVNRTAQNIAHDYKKLFEIEGNEDANGQLLDIDGYNNNAIYFHYGEQFYKLSIARTENIAEVTQNIGGIYYIFNTTSYENAYYYNGNDWFCSCDDWNNRIYYYHNTSSGSDLECNSRLGKNWQNLNNVISVSQEYANILCNLPVTNRNVQKAYIGFVFLDPNYTCPIYEDHNGETQIQAYTLYFPKMIPLDALPTIIKQGTVDAQNGIIWDEDEGDIWPIVESWAMQNTPCLLDMNILIYPLSVFIINKQGVYKAMTSASLQGEWVLIYLNNTEADPLDLGDSVFIINGVEYTYRSKTNRILDYTGQFVCNTNMLKYVGYSTRCAYFYSEFDRAIYTFEGDNAVKKLSPLEGYEINYKVYDTYAGINTLNIPSLDILLVELTTAVLILFDNQYILLQTGRVNDWSVDLNTGSFVINGIKYSLVKSALDEGNGNNNEITQVPIEIETQFYGNLDSETNNINDCVYLTVDNLMSLPSGEVKIQAVALQNQKIVKAKEKTMKLKPEDFNGLSQCLIKYQPMLQECKGFKLLIKSDFEIAELKIGTSSGAQNQTTKRI